MSNEPVAEGRAELALTPKECLAALAASRAGTAAAVAALAKVLPYARCSEGLTTSEWDECRATLDAARALVPDLTAAAQAHDAEIARAAVSDALTVDRLAAALRLIDKESERIFEKAREDAAAGVSDSYVTEAGAILRALAQSSAASDE